MLEFLSEQIGSPQWGFSSVLMPMNSFEKHLKSNMITSSCFQAVCHLGDRKLLMKEGGGKEKLFLG